jgi:hypothetical protein
MGGGLYVYENAKWSTGNINLLVPSTVPTTGLKTYTSIQYGFSFSYPAEWGSPKESGGEISFAPANPKADIPDIRLDINVVTNNNKTIDQLISDEDRQQGISVSEIQTTTLGGADAKSFLVRREGGFANYGLIAAHGKYAYKVYYGNWIEGDPVPASVQQSQAVLATFKFTH